VPGTVKAPCSRLAGPATTVLDSVMAACRACRGEVEGAHRFCPWCGSPQRSKFVEFFRGHPQIDDGRALRASRYFGPEPEERHVRFSVWTDDRAEAAVSLSEPEADRLVRFLAMPRPRGHRSVPTSAAG
jgi:hypothetical protein